MSRAEDQPWSPFPVQDWSALPGDPLARTTVDPGWAPPEPARRWWIPLLIFVVIGSMIGVAAYAGARIGLGNAPTAATYYLPKDGAASYERTDTIRELRTTSGFQVTESARYFGITGLLSTDSGFSTRMLAETQDEADTISTWRTTTTAIDNPAVTHQTVRFYRITAAVELLGESAPDAGYIYSPALVELPADIGPDQHWSSTGSAGAIFDYDAIFRSEAGDNGCLKTFGELSYVTKQRQHARTIVLERTWCPGQGVIASSESFADVRRTTVLAPAPLTSPKTVDSSITWAATERWVERDYDSISINPTFGEGSINGTAAPMLPVRTESGLLIRATDTLNDLVAFTPKTQTQWVLVWRSHVPGQILTLTAFGNVLLVTTSERWVVAYSDTGVRLWQQSLDEIAPAPPVRASDGDAVLVDLSGAVRRLGLSTGEVVWRHDVGSDVKVAPAVGDGIVVVMDRGGTTTALNAETGEPAWTLALAGEAADFLGGTLVLIQDQTAHGVVPGTGARLWLRPFFGSFNELATVGDRLVLATQTATVMLDMEGRVITRLPPYRRVTAVGQTFVGWGTAEAEVVSASGAVRQRFALPGFTLAVQDRRTVALPDGVLLTNADWTFSIFADER